MTVRVLVVDDHPAFRKALTSALSMVEGFVDACAAVGGVAACSVPDPRYHEVILLDLPLPERSVIEAMKVIHESKPDLPVLILTAHADPGVEREAREAGASGFLAKGIGLDDLVIVLHEAAEPEDEA